MQLGETLLIIGALVIFATATLYLNEIKYENEEMLWQSEFRAAAVNIAQSFIEEGGALEFDEVIVNESYVNLPDDFTSVESLGPESGETYPFDDVDDFNGYSSEYSTGRGDYTVTITVSYSDTTTLAQGYGSKTYLKIMEVIVSGELFSDSIRCNYLFCYH